MLWVTSLQNKCKQKKKKKTENKYNSASTKNRAAQVTMHDTGMQGPRDGLGLGSWASGDGTCDWRRTQGCSVGGTSGTMCPNSLPFSSPDGSPDAQPDQGQRRLHPALGSGENDLRAHTAHLRGAVQEGRSLVAGEGLCPGGARWGKDVRPYPGGYHPPGAWPQQVTCQREPLGLRVVSKPLSHPLVKKLSKLHKMM